MSAEVWAVVRPDEHEGDDYLFFCDSEAKALAIVEKANSEGATAMCVARRVVMTEPEDIVRFPASWTATIPHGEAPRIVRLGPSGWMCRSDAEDKWSGYANDYYAAVGLGHSYYSEERAVQSARRALEEFLEATARVN